MTSKHIGDLVAGDVIYHISHDNNQLESIIVTVVSVVYSTPRSFRMVVKDAFGVDVEWVVGKGCSFTLVEQADETSSGQ